LEQFFAQFVLKEINFNNCFKKNIINNYIRLMEARWLAYKGKYGSDTFKISDFASVVGFNPQQSLQPFEFFGVEQTDNLGNTINLFNQPNQWVLPVVYDTRCRDSSLSNLAYINPLKTVHKIYKSDSKLMESFESLPDSIKNYARVGETLIPAYILYRDGDTNVFINGFIKSNNQQEKYIFNGTIGDIDEMKAIIKEKITDKKQSVACSKPPKAIKAPRPRPSTTAIVVRRSRGPVEYPEGLPQPTRRIKRTTSSDPLSNWPGLVGSYQPRSATSSDTRPGSISHWRNDPNSLDARRKATTARQNADRNALINKIRNGPLSFGKSFLRNLMSEIKYLINVR